MFVRVVLTNFRSEVDFLYRNGQDYANHLQHRSGESPGPVRCRILTLAGLATIVIVCGRREDTNDWMFLQ